VKVPSQNVSWDKGLYSGDGIIIHVIIIVIVLVNIVIRQFSQEKEVQTSSEEENLREGGGEKGTGKDGLTMLKKTLERWKLDAGEERCEPRGMEDGPPCSDEPKDDDDSEQRGLEDSPPIVVPLPRGPDGPRRWYPDARPLSRLAVLCRDPEPDPEPEDPGLSLPGLCTLK
ncbi:hypothetical protein C0J52_19471, partial [Blattella germanica]